MSRGKNRRKKGSEKEKRRRRKGEFRGNESREDLDFEGVFEGKSEKGKRGKERKCEENGKRKKGRKREASQKMEASNGENGEGIKQKMRAAKIKLIERFDKEYATEEKELKTRRKKAKGSRGKGKTRGKKGRRGETGNKRGKEGPNLTRKRNAEMGKGGNLKKMGNQNENGNKFGGEMKGKNGEEKGERIIVEKLEKADLKIERNAKGRKRKKGAQKCDSEKQEMINLVQNFEEKTNLGKRNWEAMEFSQKKRSKGANQIKKETISDLVKKQMISLNKMVEDKYFKDKRKSINAKKEKKEQKLVAEIEITSEEEIEGEKDKLGKEGEQVKYAKMQTRPKKMELYVQAGIGEIGDEEREKNRRMRKRRNRRNRVEGKRWVAF